MTHDLAFDMEVLPMLLDSPVGSVGALGSKRRLARIVAELYRRGTMLDARQVERISCPVGLDIGARSPEEIATSIVAELIALGNGKPCGSLALQTGAIHAQVPHYIYERDRVAPKDGCPPLHAQSGYEVHESHASIQLRR